VAEQLQLVATVEAMVVIAEERLLLPVVVATEVATVVATMDVVIVNMRNNQFLYNIKKLLNFFLY
jgi:hypothetical protein